MYLHSYKLKNYRRLRDAHIELASDISIFVGANNSGKTSATQAIETFLSGAKDRFSLYDFSSYTWRQLEEIAAQPVEEDAQAALPVVSLDLWFSVAPADLHLVIPLLPSTAWQGTKVGIRVELGPRSSAETLSRFRAAKADGEQKAAALPNGAGDYVPWPQSLCDFLHRELQHEYELRYFVLDEAKFDKGVQADDYTPQPLGTDPGGGSLLNSIVRIDSLSAQRHLADPSSGGGGGRAEDISRRMSRFYKRHLDQRQDDHEALKALADSERGLDKHLADVFGATLKRLERLGYPGLNNPRLSIRSALNPASVMTQDARVHYVLGDGANEVVLPDSYNGLGFKNLIYMVVEILDVHERWLADETRPPLHLIFIEEPEAHLHAQLQQVFVRNVLDLLKAEGDGNDAFASQVVITTHSPHILYERGFTPIRYFRRQVAGTEQTTTVLNLSAFHETAVEDRNFLVRYLKLTHCDLFFADAAILVEGNVERLLLPLMIEKEARTLRSASLCILEVGGAFGHRFKALLEFLGITTLLITDLDSVELVADVGEAATEDDEDDISEFEVPADEPPLQANAEDGAPAPPAKQTKKGKACLPSVPGAVTSNQSLIQWLPALRTIADLWAVTDADKTRELMAGGAKVRVAYQTQGDVTWNGATAALSGRTLEEAFGLENPAWCQAQPQKHLGLKLSGNPADPAALAAGLHKRVKGKGFDKTKFALGVLTAHEGDWQVPAYIKEGLIWLRDEVPIEVETLAELPAGDDVAAAPEGEV